MIIAWHGDRMLFCCMWLMNFSNSVIIQVNTSFMRTIFNDHNLISGAEFSECRKYRYALWRKWDNNKPMVMFIGLNPSIASESQNDPTVKKVAMISKNNGFGGFYMMNCFPYISTNPNDLKVYGNIAYNDHWLYQAERECKEVVFAWGNFKIVKDIGRDIELTAMFPNAKALHINKNGSPKHPLYCKSNTLFIPFSITL